MIPSPGIPADCQQQPGCRWRRLHSNDDTPALVPVRSQGSPPDHGGARQSRPLCPRILASLLPAENHGRAAPLSPTDRNVPFGLMPKRLPGVGRFAVRRERSDRISRLMSSSSAGWVFRNRCGRATAQEPCTPTVRSTRLSSASRWKCCAKPLGRMEQAEEPAAAEGFISHRHSRSGIDDGLVVRPCRRVVNQVVEEGQRYGQVVVAAAGLRDASAPAPTPRDSPTETLPHQTTPGRQS